ncbi:enoyl-CoA hydratase/isomerase family protein [Psychrobacter sp. AOP22-C1-22]|uniref:enoyl-CoA hydratase/isomerase family protein n=1 Tax=unclassified Psychrobacter TaxID=196806 RepID=UPI001787A742|nr:MULTISPECIES: enoyl-CoA hydratase-related protein [unclassified Psychrobacter]MBE0405538.1 enoyl-CoA hydratase/isomerase family protein [Psychrobacter sp. FME6]MBE0445570.1 enoyl-CoA hydratase/isomerase family protein [Psychrobacter sp. FME5]MDN5801583.1 enoyl-CoA hydratase-related protein [Psychrobacter sp.]
MSQSLVEYQAENHIATITMNDPKTLNAFSTALKNAMVDALDKADTDEQVRVIILQGAGGHFSSGGHIGEMLENGMESEALSNKLNFMVGEVAEISLKLRNIHKPIIAKLEGAVAGAGMNLALTCDFRIAADNAKFVQAFVNIGLIPDAGGIYLLNQLIGVAKTTEMVMLGDKLKADDMARLNLVNQVVSNEELEASVLALATRLSNLPGKALASMKHMINTHAYMGLNEALDMEVDQQTMLAKTDDFKEGITAFMEKRKPVYQGK